MPKICIFSSCLKNSKNSPNLRFIPFVKPWTDRKRALRWLEITGRTDINVDNIKHSNYICETHFPPNLHDYDWKTNPSLEPISSNETSIQDKQIASLKSLVEILDPQIILDCVCEKLFQAFSLSDLEEKMLQLEISKGVYLLSKCY